MTSTNTNTPAPCAPQDPPLSGTVRQAFAAAFPIMAGYVVLGLPCGILCAAAGMEVWMVAVMSVLFYSGAGQYMIPNMWLAANPVSAIIASVGLVNTRQMLYGATLSQFCGNASRALTFFFGATVTDESFGVNYAKFVEGPWTVRHALFVNLFSHSAWILSNTAGAVVGAAVAVPTALASFAMTSLFICLLCMQELVGASAVAAIAAVLGVVACKLVGLGSVAILVGAVFGVAAALAYGALHPTAPRAAAADKPCDPATSAHASEPAEPAPAAENPGAPAAPASPAELSGACFACPSNPAEGGEPACR